MRYNPCGRIVDVGHVAYNRRCRFFSNSDVVSQVRWQEAEEGAPVLGFESVILSRQMEPDRWFEQPIGEVEGDSRTVTLAKAPRGLVSDHVCGTEAEFRDGGTRDPSLPPVQYGATGWPMCCFPPKKLRGGAAAGGRAALVVTDPGIRGGAAAGGRAVYAVDPASPTPGSDCATSPTLALDVEYSYPTITGGPSGDWFRFNGLTAAAVYHLTYVGPVGSLPLFFGFSTCGGAHTLLTQVFHAPDCYEFTFSSGPNLLLEVRTFGPSNGPYTFTLSAGAC